MKHEKMSDISTRSTRRFRLSEDQARNWLRHAVAAYLEYLNGDKSPADLEGPRPENNLPEIHDDWDPRSPGNEADVYSLIRDAVDAGIIGTPAEETVNGAPERWDLDFCHSDDSDGGGYYFMISLGFRLKLATRFEEMRRLGERPATGITAAMAILREAVASANATLDALDELVAARHGLKSPHSDDPSSLIAEHPAIADLRSSMEDGYDDDCVNRVLGHISAASGLRIVCVWDYYDADGVGGNSDFYVDVDGQLHHCAGDLWRWLNDSPEDPDTPPVPGPPASWVGTPADFRKEQLPYDDGHHNYAIRDYVDGADAAE